MYEPYHIATNEEYQDYSLLVGPNGFTCSLGEPEDRDRNPMLDANWDRYGKPVVTELNRLAAENKRLTDEVVFLKTIYTRQTEAHRCIRQACDLFEANSADTADPWEDKQAAIRLLERVYDRVGNDQPEIHRHILPPGLRDNIRDYIRSHTPTAASGDPEK